MFEKWLVLLVKYATPATIFGFVITWAVRKALNPLIFATGGDAVESAKSTGNSEIVPIIWATILIAVFGGTVATAYQVIRSIRG